MTGTLLLAPHADDETLFASYLAQRYAAHIAVVYDEGRESELAQATQWLGCTYQQLPVPKGADAERVEEALNGFDPMDWSRVIIPMPYAGEYGHEEHNLVGSIGQRLFSDTILTGYRTYEQRGARDTRGVESFPDEPSCIARKLAALSCYRSQIADPATSPWFYSLLDMREWTA